MQVAYLRRPALRQVRLIYDDEEFETMEAFFGLRMGTDSGWVGDEVRCVGLGASRDVLRM